VEINLQTIITLAAAASAIGVFAKLYNKCYDLVRHQHDQDNRINALEKNDTAVMRALLGVLDGLIEQGCNGTVHAARDELQRHLTERSTK